MASFPLSTAEPLQMPKRSYRQERLLEDLHMAPRIYTPSWTTIYSLASSVKIHVYCIVFVYFLQILMSVTESQQDQQHLRIPCAFDCMFEVRDKFYIWPTTAYKCKDEKRPGCQPISTT